ncbi:MAG TPA: DUF4412 domain-containing protein [Polyangiaceae bacterium]
MRTALVLGVVLLSIGCNGGKKLDGFEGDITLHTTSATQSQDMVLEVKKDKMRFDSTSADGPVHGVLDPVAHKVTLYSDPTKTYTDLDFSGAKGQSNTSGDTANVKQTGKHETIAGYDCEDWTVNDPSGKRTELCVAQGLVYFDLGSLRGGGQSTSPLSKQFEEMKSFPLRSVEFDASGKELTRSEVTKIEPKSVDDARFLPPAGYTQISLKK